MRDTQISATPTFYADSTEVIDIGKCFQSIYESKHPETCKLFFVKEGCNICAADRIAMLRAQKHGKFVNLLNKSYFPAKWSEILGVTCVLKGCGLSSETVADVSFLNRNPMSMVIESRYESGIKN